jgi:ATP-binding cassette subfamily B protein
MKSLLALNGYIWRYRTLVLLGILVVTVSNFFAVYPAQIVRIAINMVSEVLGLFSLFRGFEAAKSLESLLAGNLILFGILVLLMAALRGVFLFFTRQTLIVMSRKVEFDLRSDLYHKFQELTLSFYRRNRTGDLMARLTEDVSRVRMYLGPGIMYSLSTLTLFIVTVSTMLVVNWELTLYSLIPLPILSYLVYFVESRILKRSEEVQEQLSRLTTYTQEMFSGIRVVKAYVKEADAESRFDAETETYKRKSMHLAAIDAFFFPVVVMLVGLSVLITVWIGGERVIAGRLTMGNIAEFIMYINLLTWPIISVGWVSTMIQRAAASQQRLNVLLAERPEIRFPETGPQPQTAALAFDDVSYTYPDTGIEAIRNVTFRLSPGQKLGIVGPTGSGKSTLCALIPRLLEAEDGTIALDGRDIKVYTKEDLRQNLGYAPQDVFLFSDTVKGNIAFGHMAATDDEVVRAATRAAVHDNIVDFQQGYDTVVGERGVTLSGGQKQRISLARAWVREPKLLILDDILSAVDTHTEETVLQHLRDFRQLHPESAVVQVAHRISCIQDSDLILVLENGRITQAGTHEDLIQQDGFYGRIHRKQLMEAAETGA